MREKLAGRVLGEAGVVVLANGRIAEQGTHQALLRANGLYARLHAQGFSSDPEAAAT